MQERRIVVVVGGPGWERQRLPAHVNVAHDLSHGIDLVEQALGE